MLAVHVELLAGRYAATAYNDREAVEWPPHPARLFSALVATWGDADPRSPDGIAERAALEWLERQAAPEIHADVDARARSVMPARGAGYDPEAPRPAVQVFVPVNDEHEVSEVDRSKLDEAEASFAAAASDAKAQAKAQKLVDKLRAKVVTDTAKVIAPPARPGKDPRAGLKVLPELRQKQPRTFPVAFPASAAFAFAWPAAAPDAPTRAALERILKRLVRIGHSSSQVSATLVSAAELERLLPPGDGRVVFRPDDADGEHVVRWVEAGQVARLCRAYDSHREIEPRVLPARFVRYTRRGVGEAPRVHHSVFGDEPIVYARVRGPRLAITAVAVLSRQLRRAMQSGFGSEPIDPVLSGHLPNGQPLDRPHVAIIPLPYVIGEFGDGSILGIAVVLPRDIQPSERRAVLRALGSLERVARRDEDDDDATIRLNLDPEPLVLERVAWDGDTSKTLSRRTWCRPSERWATATPIALDRNPGDLTAEDPARRAAAFAEAAASVVESITRIGLPEPLELDVVRSCVLPGTAKPRSYPRFPSDPARVQRVLVHARIRFHERVRGPVLLGAGRYQGLGLCLPVDDLRRGDA